jgi:CheY-like chemotaxis protein
MQISGPILLVDDDEDDHDILREVCKNLGICHALKFFYDGNSLLDYLNTTKEWPFIILCDINMPHINGLDLREVIWKDNDLRKKTVPFVFFSTASTDLQVRRAYDLTVQGFFLKGHSLSDTERKLKIIFEYWAECKRPLGK